jgi:glycosyltransferase involved in cell wall biosynthesis
MLADVEILELIKVAETCGGRRNALVVFTFPVRKGLIENLLARPSIPAVVLANESEWTKYSQADNVGFRYGPDCSLWHVPDSDAESVIVVGGIGTVGLRIVTTALRGSNIKAFVFVNPRTKAIVPYSWRALSLRLLIKSLRSRARHAFEIYDRFVRRVWASMRSFLVRLRRVLLSLLFKMLPEMPLKMLPEMPRFEWIFAYRLRRILRFGRALAAPADNPKRTIVLSIGSLSRGGSERQAVNTALMIKRAGTFRPVLVCMRLQDSGAFSYRSILDAAAIDVIDVSQIHEQIGVEPAYKRLLSFCESDTKLGYGLMDDVARFLAVLLNEKPCIVHSFLDETNVKIGIASALAYIPRIILSARSVAPDNFMLHRQYMRPAYRVLLESPEFVLCNNSHAGARDYRRWLKKYRQKIDVVHNGVDFEAFPRRLGIDFLMRDRLGIPRDVLVLGSVMRLSEEKQPELWARIVIEISRCRPKVHFVLIGDGPLREETEYLLALAGIETRAHFIRATRDVAGVLAALDLFLLTSRMEGLPNVLIEAQAVGLPVVTTPAGGAPEALDPGRTGLVAPDHSVLGIAQTCLALLDNNELRTRMSDAAPSFVRQKFSLERMFKDTMRLYDV